MLIQEYAEDYIFSECFHAGKTQGILKFGKIQGKYRNFMSSFQIYSIADSRWMEATFNQQRFIHREIS